jgi:hypothetical protein
MMLTIRVRVIRVDPSVTPEATAVVVMSVPFCRCAQVVL